MSQSNTRRTLRIAVIIGVIFVASSGQAQWMRTSVQEEDILYLSSKGATIFESSYGRSIHRSTDNGENWTEPESGLTNDGVNQFLFSGSNLFAATFGGVFVSPDNGDHWTSI